MRFTEDDSIPRKARKTPVRSRTSKPLAKRTATDLEADDDIVGGSVKPLIKKSKTEKMADDAEDGEYELDV